MPPVVNEPTYLSVVEVAQQLSVNPATVRRWIREGHLPTVQCGGPGASVRVPRGALQRWLYSIPPDEAA